MTTRAKKIAFMKAEVVRLKAEANDLANPSIGTLVDDLVWGYMIDHRGISYSDALAAVLASNPEMELAFRESFSKAKAVS